RTGPPASPISPYTTLFRSAAAFHRREIGAIGTAVARAGGDHHSAAAHRAPVGELQQHRIPLARALAIEAPQLHRNQHPRAEFLRDRKSTRLNSSHQIISYA